MLRRICIAWGCTLLLLSGIRTAAGGGLPHDRLQDTLPAAEAKHTPAWQSPRAGEQMTPDSLDSRVTERNQRLYDSIASKSSRRAFSRMLYSLLFVHPHRDTSESGRILDESRLLAPYAGKTIGEIRIKRAQVFAEDGNWLERTGNKLHALTRERIIRRDLLFRTGEPLNPELIVRSQQLLHSRSYIADTDVQVVPDPLDSTRVDIVLLTRDSWTIGIDAALHSEGHTMIGLSDGNFLGSGTRFKVETNFSRKDFSYGGNLIGYEIPNVLGSFFSFEAEVGRNFYEETLRIALRKEFLKPTDYEAGITYTDLRSKYWMPDTDSSVLVKVRNLDLWAGRSHELQGLRSNLFYTLRYNYARFSERPEVADRLHPALHDHDDLLAGIGLYREHLYTTNMVFGFGTKEYVASGYKAELTGGYSWGEFNDNIYLGIGFRAGGFLRSGFLMAGFTLGSHIDHRSGAWNRSAVDADFLWFSNLLAYRRCRLRQFLALRYTQGWNRHAGYEESITFTAEEGLQAFNQHVVGCNRLVLNTETILFTPFQPLGFRFAFFGFVDGGLLGYSPNPLKNHGFVSFGLGLRLRNERLIFSTLQIRLGIAFGKGGVAGDDWFSLSNNKYFRPYRFLPTRPEVVPFR